MNIQEKLLDKAGVKAHHKNYRKKLDQLHKLKLSDGDVEKIYELDGAVLNFLFMGTLTIDNRYAFISGLSSRFDLAVKALNQVDVETLVEVLEKIEANLGRKDTPTASDKWNELGLELAIGIDEDPLILLRRYWE
jgi:hypothetical protein